MCRMQEEGEMCTQLGAVCTLGSGLGWSKVRTRSWLQQHCPAAHPGIPLSLDLMPLSRIVLSTYCVLSSVCARLYLCSSVWVCVCLSPVSGQSYAEVLSQYSMCHVFIWASVQLCLCNCVSVTGCIKSPNILPVLLRGHTGAVSGSAQRNKTRPSKSFGQHMSLLSSANQTSLSEQLPLGSQFED